MFTNDICVIIDYCFLSGIAVLLKPIIGDKIIIHIKI